MVACISSLGHDQYSSDNFDELFNLRRYKRYLDFSSHEVNDHLDNHSNKRLKFSQDDGFFNVKKRVLEFSSNELQCLKIEAGSLYLPKDNPKKPLGEDAHFIDELFKTIGVADGVGGWAKQGIDAGIYSRELMKNSHIVTYYEAMKGHVNPKRVLEEANENTNSKGLSTACIVTFNSEKVL
uniref:Protein phosphatase n=1 Tax=Solanum lycopersicum TaxID=4081 RepID=A0A3Q7HXL2_SOLLC